MLVHRMPSIAQYMWRLVLMQRLVATWYCLHNVSVKRLPSCDRLRLRFLRTPLAAVGCEAPCFRRLDILMDARN